MSANPQVASSDKGAGKKGSTGDGVDVAAAPAQQVASVRIERVPDHWFEFAMAAAVIVDTFGAEQGGGSGSGSGSGAGSGAGSGSGSGSGAGSGAGATAAGVASSPRHGDHAAKMLRQAQDLPPPAQSALGALAQHLATFNLTRVLRGAGALLECFTRLRLVSHLRMLSVDRLAAFRIPCQHARERYHAARSRGVRVHGTRWARAHRCWRECADIDARPCLHVLMWQSTGQRHGSLLWLLSHCRTPFGARCLADWLRRPLHSRAKIEARLEAVAELAGLGTSPHHVGDGEGDDTRAADQGAPYCMLELLEVMGELPDLEKGYACVAVQRRPSCVRKKRRLSLRWCPCRLTRIIQCSCTPLEAASTLVVFQRVLSVLPDPAVVAAEVRCVAVPTAVGVSLLSANASPVLQIRSSLLRELLASVPGVRHPVAKFVGHIRPSVIDAASSGRKSSPSKAKLVRLKWGTISKRKPTAANAVGAGDVFTRAYERETFDKLTTARVSA